MLDVTLPNIGLYRQLMIEKEEVKRHIYELFDKRVSRPNI